MTATQQILPTDADVASYRECGFYLSDLILPADVLDAAERGMQRFYAGERDRSGPHGVEEIGWRREHGNGLRKNDYASLRVDELAQLVAHPAIGAIAARLSGASGIRLWADQLLYKPVDAGGPAANVGWHTDRQYWQTCSSQEMLTAWVPFHDVDEASGSITFVEGSHGRTTDGLDFFEADLDRQEAALNAGGHPVVKVPAALRRGQVSFHHCGTIHGSGPNHSSEPRRSLAIHLQPNDNRHRGAGDPHRSDQLCRRTGDGLPDYTDPALFPLLWPPAGKAPRRGGER